MIKRLGFVLLFATAIVACSDDDDSTEVIVDTSLPQGGFNVEKTGSIVAQNDTNSKGGVEFGKDGQGASFLHFGQDFETVLSTGTVTVFFSTSSEYITDPANGNPDLQQVGPVLDNGEMFFKIENPVDAKFTHIILWCGSAQLSFGFAELN